MNLADAARELGQAFAETLDAGHAAMAAERDDATFSGDLSAVRRRAQDAAKRMEEALAAFRRAEAEELARINEAARRRAEEERELREATMAAMSPIPLGPELPRSPDMNAEELELLRQLNAGQERQRR